MFGLCTEGVALPVLPATYDRHHTIPCHTMNDSFVMMQALPAAYDFRHGSTPQLWRGSVGTNSALHLYTPTQITYMLSYATLNPSKSTRANEYHVVGIHLPCQPGSVLLSES